MGSSGCLQGGRTWQKVVVGFSGPLRSATPQVPHVKGAISLDFEPSTFARTVRRTHASAEGGISFNSYRWKLFVGQAVASPALDLQQGVLLTCDFEVYSACQMHDLSFL